MRELGKSDLGSGSGQARARWFQNWAQGMVGA